MAALAEDPRLNRDGLRTYFGDMELDGSLNLELWRLLLGQAALGDATAADVAFEAARTDLRPSQRARGRRPGGRRRRRRQDSRPAWSGSSWPSTASGWARGSGYTSPTEGGHGRRHGGARDRRGVPRRPGRRGHGRRVDAHPPRPTPSSTSSGRSRPVPGRRACRGRRRRRGHARRAPVEGAVAGDAPHVLRLTPTQREGLRLDPVSGSVLVVTRLGRSRGDRRPRGPSRAEGRARGVAPRDDRPADTVVVTFKVRLGGPGHRRRLLAVWPRGPASRRRGSRRSRRRARGTTTGGGRRGRPRSRPGGSSGSGSSSVSSATRSTRS